MSSEEHNNLKSLNNDNLGGVVGGIKKKYIGGATDRNRCKAENGEWYQRCDNPNWVNVGKPFTIDSGDNRVQQICLNCGAQAQFRLDNNGSWTLPSDLGTDD